MIIEKLVEIILKLILSIIDMLSIPATPDFIANTMDVFYSKCIDGIQFAQYFFNESTYNTFIRLLLALFVLKPTAIVVLWLYDKFRGC